MSGTKDLYGMRETNIIKIKVPCATTPPGNIRLSVYMDRLSNLVTNLTTSQNLIDAKSSIQYLRTEIKTSNPTIPFPI